MQNQSQSRLGRTRFPALGVGYVYWLRVFIGSLCCLRLMWLAIVIKFYCFGFENRAIWTKNAFTSSIFNLACWNFDLLFSFLEIDSSCSPFWARGDYCKWRHHPFPLRTIFWLAPILSFLCELVETLKYNSANGCLTWPLPLHPSQKHCRLLSL